MPEPSLVTEAQLQQTIIEYAQARKWRVAHFRPGMTSRVDKKGKPVWVTPVQADGKGFPDLICTKERVVFIEVKSAIGVLSEAQKGWRDALLGAGAEWHCFGPQDWAEIEQVLE